MKRLKLLTERVKLAVALQSDFQLGQIEVFSIIQISKQGFVEDLGQPLVGQANATVHRHVENYGMERDASRDRVEQSGNLGALQFDLENIGCRLAAHLTGSDGVTEDFGEQRFT